MPSSINVTSSVGGPFLDLLKPSRYKAFYGGRGGAKSHGCAEMAVIRSLNKRQRVVGGRQFQSSIKESMKQLIEQKIEQLGVTELFEITEYKIKSKINDSEFIFIGMDRNPQSMKSLEDCDIFIGEEADFFSLSSITMLEPTIRNPGSELWFIWNPTKKGKPVDEMFRGEKGPPPDSIVHRVSWRDNPYFKLLPLYQHMLTMKERDYLKYMHVYEGEYERLADSQVFKHWKTGVLNIDNKVPMLGCDWGFSNDPMALTKSYLLDGDTTLYIEAEAVAKGVSVENTPAFFDLIPATRQYITVADNARPELIDHMCSKGYRVEPCKKGSGSVKEGVAWIQAKNVVINPSCTNAIKEFENYSYVVDRDGTILPVLEDENNHVIDAIRYSTEPHRTPAPVFRTIRF